MALSAVHGETTFAVGDTVRVHLKIHEEGKERTTVFEGTVLAIRGEGENRMFTVRRLGAGGIGIERVFPLTSPLLERVEVKAKGYVRRAKLYYLREKPPSAYAELTKRKVVKVGKVPKVSKAQKDVHHKGGKAGGRSRRKTTATKRV